MNKPESVHCSAKIGEKVQHLFLTRLVIFKYSSYRRRLAAEDSVRFPGYIADFPRHRCYTSA